MRHEGFAVLDHHLRSVAAQLFEQCGHAPRFAPVTALPDPPGVGILAVIGFTTAHARGSITLLGTPGIARTLGGAAACADAADVIAEFCNMLMGRFKNRLSQHGVAVEGTLPMVTTGSNVKLGWNGGTDTIWHEVVLAGGPLFVRLDAVLDDGFRVATTPEDPSAAAVEGDVLIF